MNIESAKQELAEWILNLKDDSIIERIKMLKDNQKNLDWWFEITEAEKASIEKGKTTDIKANINIFDNLKVEKAIIYPKQILSGPIMLYMSYIQP